MTPLEPHLPMPRWARGPLRRTLAAVGLLFGLAVAAACSSADPTPQASPSASAAASSSFTNPVLGRGADPFVTVVDGRYWSIQSTQNAISLRSSTSVVTLGTAEPQVIFQGGDEGSPCCEWWAPELHQIDGRWYVYVAADDGDNKNHRSYVLESDAIDGPYRFAGQLKLPGNRWSIDVTVFEVGSQRYVSWSGWPGGSNGQQNLYLAELATPTKARGPAALISEPRLDWETKAGTVGVLVNEGPAALIRNGKVFLTYSGSGCWTPDYAIGLLTADADADLLDPKSWTKDPEPLFRASEESGQWGTGHHSFFTSPDGTETWFAYHAVTSPEGSCGEDREIYLRPLGSGPGGRPDFGAPSPSGEPVPLPAGDPGA
ncbi:MAG: GH43_26 / GH43_27 / GH43 / GH43_33 / GH43_ 31 / GH43_30 / GH43_3 [uncultured Friedmanniella sp.]|uniref:GH43_26 / GH43_27 / GH43 / GH43_33 / GH43_ 31 / GH43_30 / GH43_3 n=1 Tax=uncultured Friedmanniella sp. TaxID=335381 RepID=A0A6J4LL84_9ACTN|nr:glycoside hydrolase family 43 protein [uncultured Friedmanniella sp.]CAA9333890.1 MAG: GH43_26 / GH43_27 / GH43 / GH43_33 / GH43_ 31 / GH43_30 / GH43_3 [uncultured Friedmanniella sp.]